MTFKFCHIFCDKILVDRFKERPTGLTSIELQSFKTDKVMDMFSMFEDCSSLTSLDLSHFITEAVTYFFELVQKELKYLNIKGFNALLIKTFLICSLIAKN